MFDVCVYLSRSFVEIRLSELKKNNNKKEEENQTHENFGTFLFLKKKSPQKKTGIKTRNWIQLNWLVFVKLLSKWIFDRLRHVVFFGVVWRQFNRFFDFNVVQCQLFNRKYDSIYLVTTTKFQHLKKTTKKNRTLQFLWINRI